MHKLLDTHSSCSLDQIIFHIFLYIVEWLTFVLDKFFPTLSMISLDFVHVRHVLITFEKIKRTRICIWDIYVVDLFSCPELMVASLRAGFTFSFLVWISFVDTCPFMHQPPSLSSTILFPVSFESMWVYIQSKHVSTLASSSIDSSDSRDEDWPSSLSQRYFEVRDFLVSCLEMFGTIDRLCICGNSSRALQGSIYVQFSDEIMARRCVDSCRRGETLLSKCFLPIRDPFQSRKSIADSVEYVPLHSLPEWKNAVCEEWILHILSSRDMYGLGECSRGAACPFLHPFCVSDHKSFPFEFSTSFLRLLRARWRDRVEKFLDAVQV